LDSAWAESAALLATPTCQRNQFRPPSSFRRSQRLLRRHVFLRQYLKTPGRAGYRNSG
jgi:hypothetical protein